MSYQKSKPMHKFVLLGSERVGKTSIARRYLGQEFNPKYNASIGVNISYIDITHTNNREYNVLFWDMAGSEKFKLLREMYFQGATGIMLIIDTMRPSTFKNLDSWFDGVSQEQLQDLSIACLINKVDLLEERGNTNPEIDEELKRVQKRLNVPYIMKFETSALTGEGIFEALHWLITESLFHTSKRKDFWFSVFNPAQYPYVLYKLTNRGTEPVLHDVSSLYHVNMESMYAYLVNLGIKISVLVGQGQNYSTGVNDISEGIGDVFRLLVYTFRCIDGEAEDPRMTNNFLQLIFFIPMRHYSYFVSFSKSEFILNSFADKFESIQSITDEDINILRKELFLFFKDQVNLADYSQIVNSAYISLQDQ